MAAGDDIDKIIQEISPYYAKKKQPSEQHDLVYDSSSETLEPIYFWIVDLMNSMFSNNVEKIMDNFSSTPGSGHFAELGQRATVMQQQASNTLATIGTIVKSILNILWDLREFRIRLKNYESLKSNNKEEAKAGLLALKQIWMDSVDMKRGAGSINALTTGQLNFVTLRDAFFAANSVDDVDKNPEKGGLDLNDRVKRILKARLNEFYIWADQSEKELKKRYEIEKTYLKSQLGSLQLYTRWVKPYLRAASQLQQKTLDKSPDLVKTFNTIILELALIGKIKISVKDSAYEGSLPENFGKRKFNRDYFSIVLVDFRFRGIPQRVGQQQHYAFGGRAEISFRAYSLNSEELEKLDEKLKENDIDDALSLASQITDESLDQMKADINEFLEDETPENLKIHKHQEKSSNDVNPFAALFGLYKKKENKDKSVNKDKQEKIKKDSYYEDKVRKLAEKGARQTAYKIFDVYKKAHGMASHPDPFAW